MANTSAPSASCETIGAMAAKIVTWRDQGGAAWMAKAQLDRHIDEQAARQAAHQLVDIVYSEQMKQLTAAAADVAFAQSCASAAQR